MKREVSLLSKDELDKNSSVFLLIKKIEEKVEIFLDLRMIKLYN